MFSDLNIFKTASALAKHSTVRQNAIAQNIANADTPKYRAQDIPAFADTFNSYQVKFAPQVAGFKNIPRIADSQNLQLQEYDVPGNMKPNGNSVSLETEMVKSTEVQFSHNMALTAYKFGMDILRQSVGRGR